MSEQYGDSDDKSAKTKEAVLEALKNAGITDLDQLAEAAAKEAGAGGAGSISASWIVHPGWVINT